MSPVSLDELLERIPSKFTLVMIAAKRARQIKDGAPRLVDTHSVNPVTVALEEITAGRIVLDNGVGRVTDEHGVIMHSPAPELGDLLALPGAPDALDARGADGDAPSPGAAAAALGAFENEDASVPD